jgi:hypothetical protein
MRTVGRVFKIRKKDVDGYGYVRPGKKLRPNRGVTTIAAVNGRGAHRRAQAKVRGQMAARSLLRNAARKTSARSALGGLSRNAARTRARVLTDREVRDFAKKLRENTKETGMLRNARRKRRGKKPSAKQLAARRAFASRFGGKKVPKRKRKARKARRTTAAATKPRRTRKRRTARKTRRTRTTVKTVRRTKRRRAAGKTVTRKRRRKARKSRAASATPKRRRVRRKRRKASAAPRRTRRKRRKAGTRRRARRTVSTRRRTKARRSRRKAPKQLTANRRRRSRGKRRGYRSNRRRSSKRRSRRTFRRNDSGLMMTALKVGALGLVGLIASKSLGNVIGRGIEGVLPEGMKPYSSVFGSFLFTAPAVWATMKFMPDKQNATSLAGGMVVSFLHTLAVSVVAKIFPNAAPYLAGAMDMQGVSIQPHYRLIQGPVGEYYAPMGEYFREPGAMGEYFESGVEGLGNYTGNPEIAQAAAGYNGLFGVGGSNHIDPSNNLDRELTLVEAAAGIGQMPAQAAGGLSPFEAMGNDAMTVGPVPSANTWVPGTSYPSLWAPATAINNPQSTNELVPAGVLETEGGNGIFA